MIKILKTWLIIRALFAPLPAIAQTGQLGAGQVWGNSSASKRPAAPTSLTINGLLGTAPTFTVTNPGNAATYGILANPANGYLTTYNGFQFSQGAVIPAIRQFGANAVGVQQTLVGTLSLAAGDTAIQGNGTAGYAESNSTAQSPVGAFGQAAFGLNGGNAFGSNFIAQNCITVIAGSCFNINFMTAAELNPNFWTTGSGNPTIAAGAYGLWIQGGGNIAGPFGSAAIGIGTASAVSLTNAQWNNSIWSRNGSAVTALRVGAVSTANSSASQSVVFNSLDSGGSTQTASIFSDLNGAFYVSPQSGSNFIVTNSATAQIVSLSTAGIVTNNSSGVLATSPVVPLGVTPYIDVRNYAVAPKTASTVCNGSGDDTATIQAAVDAATTAVAGTVVFPANNCLVSSPGIVLTDKYNVKLLGQGAGNPYTGTKARITYTSAAGNLLVLTGVVGLEISNLEFYYNNAAYAGDLIDLRQSGAGLSSNIDIHNFVISGTSGTAVSANSLIRTGGTLNLHIHDGFLQYSTRGIHNSGAEGAVNNVNVHNVWFQNLTSQPVTIAGNAWNLHDNAVEPLNGLASNAGWAIGTGNCYGCTIANNNIGDANSLGTWIDLTGGTFVGGSIRDNLISTGLEHVSLGASSGVTLTGNRHFTSSGASPVIASSATFATITSNWCTTISPVATCPIFQGALAQSSMVDDQNGVGFQFTGPVRLGIAGTAVGSLGFQNATSGTITLSPVTGALGTVAIAVPATAGTLATTATSPVTLNATTGVVACATCVTSSGGGAITGTSPISVSAAGAVSLSFPALTSYTPTVTSRGGTCDATCQTGLTKTGFYMIVGKMAYVRGEIDVTVLGAGAPTGGMNVTLVPATTAKDGSQSLSAANKQTGAGASGLISLDSNTTASFFVSDSSTFWVNPDKLIFSGWYEIN